MSSALWTEKYRPKTIEQLDCSPFLKRFLQHAVVHGFPHLLLYGPPGTGKTTFASLLKPTFELNASDDRGIDTIRNKIKKLANTVATQVILLDECENLTRDSQTCLRRILEDFPNTRFIFCTNYYSKIIDPLKSRLLKLKFTLKESKALENIGRQEGMVYSTDFYNELFKKCGCDLRKCLNIMQGMKPILNKEILNKEILNKEVLNKEVLNKEVLQNIKQFDVDEFVGILKPEVIDQFRAITFVTYKKFIDFFMFEGFNFLQLVYQLSEHVGTDNQKAEFSKILAECEYKSVQGCCDEVCLAFLCLKFISIYKKE